MILLNDDKQVEALEARRLAEEQQLLNQEPPPTYASLHHPPFTPNSPTSPTTSEPPTSKPTNYVSITRTHSNIKERITLDPSLYIPSFLLPPLRPGETEETRKNVRLESTYGNTYVKVRFVDGEGERFPMGVNMGAGMNRTKEARKRVTMEMKSTHGGITAKIQDTPTRPPIHLHLSSTNGSILLSLPRSFHGPMHISLRHGSIKFSDQVSAQLTTFGEAKGTQTCFVGDFSKRLEVGREGGWGGDEVVLEGRYGGVKVVFEGEGVGGEGVGGGGGGGKGRVGFLNRVFGF